MSAARPGAPARPARFATAVAAVAAVAAVVLGAVASWLPCPPATAAPPPITYRPPVDAPVVDPFRPPPTPWSAGNRGVDYQPEPGTTVSVAAPGLVVFAGPVAGALHVTVEHADGLRTTYSFLAEVAVTAGQVLGPDAVVGVAGPLLHVGVRDLLGTYLDPLGLFGRPVRAVLVPGGDDGAPRGGPGELEALAGVVGEAWRRWGPSLPGLPGLPGLSMLEALGPLAVAHELLELSPVVRLERMTRRVVGALTRPCTPGDRPVPPASERRIVVLVGGFGSTSDGAGVDDVDVAALGYDPDDVLRFSYRGGRTPPPSGVRGSLAALPSSTYDATDSQGDLPTAGDELALLLAQVAEAEPGVPIDVVAHSQGGVVTRLALDRAATEGMLPEQVDAVVTLGTPHGGADLATAAAALSSGPGGDLPVQVLAELGVPVDPTQPAVAQLAEVSPVIAHLDEVGVPAGVRLTSVGARGDLTVPAGRTVVDGAHHVVVPLAGVGAHDELPGSAAATREIGLALAGLAPTCEGAADVLVDTVVSEGIAWGEDLVGLGGAGAAANLPAVTDRGG